MSVSPLTVLSLSAALLNVVTGMTLGSYFPNWAQYRASPFKFTPAQLSAAANLVDDINYGFAFFCPNTSWVQPYWVTQLGLCRGKQPFQLTSVEPKDPEFYRQIAALKSQNPNLKFVLSVGGWTFPSHFFSGMVANAASRQTFIQSCMSFMKQYNIDGIDLDWEYPCSASRTDEVKITCTHFDAVTDQGGASCPTDAANFVTLVKEMRQAFGSSKIISVAGRGTLTKGGYDVKGMSQYISYFNVMSYDLTVSDIKGSNVTAPNSPLIPPNAPGVTSWSISGAINEYIKGGAPPSKLRVGIAYYGHTWYVPGLTGTQWQKFGLRATIQGQCCTPFAQTYGAKYGKYSQQCGLLMYSEIKAAGFQTFFDPTTQSNIGYLSSAGKDGTAAGTWVSYNDMDSMKSIVNWAKKMNLAGVFVFDLSEDTNDGNGPTFGLTKMLRQNV